MTEQEQYYKRKNETFQLKQHELKRQLLAENKQYKSDLMKVKNELAKVEHNYKNKLAKVEHDHKSELSNLKLFIAMAGVFLLASFLIVILVFLF